MPFNRTDPMKERVKFILAWEKRWQDSEGGRVDVTELCRVFGVSRDTGHRWIRRYRDANHDLRVLEERSRRPHSSPTATPQPMQDLIVAARKARPRWGPRKLRAWLVERHPGRNFPSAATFATVLKRHGLTTPRRRGRRRVPGAVEPFAPAATPNAVWCIDFKGHFRTGDGDKCLPMTVVDAFSRYCLRCEVVRETTYEDAQWVLDSAFREFGLPGAIRSDNGPPFAAQGPAGLSRLAVWLLRLAIRIERIQPGKPQQNGRLERFHRTLKDETATPPEKNLRAQQRAFDLFRADYNHERPHEALDNKVPASKYVPSTRRYPRGLIQPPTGSFGQVLAVDKNGFLRWGRHRIFVSTALVCERVEVLPDGDTGWLVQFGPVELGRFDDQHPDRGLHSKPRPRRDNYLQL